MRWLRGTGRKASVQVDFGKTQLNCCTFSPGDGCGVLHSFAGGGGESDQRTPCNSVAGLLGKEEIS